jgi:IclR family transcriptional regulator, acetate operon repressor
MGKAVMASMDLDQFRRAMRRNDWTAFDPVALTAELAEVRRRGCAFEDEEHVVGVRSLATPLIDRRGYGFGALAIVGPAVNLNPDRTEAWIAQLLDAAQQVSIQLGGHPPQLNPVSPE